MPKKDKDIAALNEVTEAQWRGHFVEAELHRPGGRLMAALIACAADRGHLYKELAQRLDVTPGYLTQLRSGFRNVHSIGVKFARDCARYLGISPVKVMLLAGRLETEDFFDPSEPYAGTINSALETIVRDGSLGHLIPLSLRQADSDTQHAVVRLYERATGMQLLPQDQAAQVT